MPETDSTAKQTHGTITVFAPAKINLTLHVTGQRDDGYHLLDSLVAFAGVGDILEVRQGNACRLTTRGPEAGDVPTDASNLILKVAGLFASGQQAEFSLTKNLPVASGVGGGSADAAAAYRGLVVSNKDACDDQAVLSSLLRLGADIPMCVTCAVARVGGIGERIENIDFLPRMPAVLINPRRAVSTAAVFKAMRKRDNAQMPVRLPKLRSIRDWASWLSHQRNDMEPAAIDLEPEITAVKTVLAAQSDCLISRMSGSGATCFGLFPSPQTAMDAAAKIARAHPQWWVKATELGSQTTRAQPQIS